MQKIYLAGGMNSGWQEVIIERFKTDFIFYNPAKHKLLKPSEYTAWDLHYVKNSDIVFAFMEKENPSGFGLTLEVGYAKALNKTIILVDEKSESDKYFEDFFKIVHESSSVVFDNLGDALEYLKRFSTNYI